MVSENLSRTLISAGGPCCWALCCRYNELTKSWVSLAPMTFWHYQRASLKCTYGRKMHVICCQFLEWEVVWGWRCLSTTSESFHWICGWKCRVHLNNALVQVWSGPPGIPPLIFSLVAFPFIFSLYLFTALISHLLFPCQGPTPSATFIQTSTALPFFLSLSGEETLAIKHVYWGLGVWRTTDTLCDPALDPRLTNE